jgi:archaellum component FlaD/FlaE
MIFVKYKLIDEVGKDNLNRIVNDYQKLGWKPVGGKFALMENHYYQTLMLDKSPKKLTYSPHGQQKKGRGVEFC